MPTLCGFFYGTQKTNNTIYYVRIHSYGLRYAISVNEKKNSANQRDESFNKSIDLFDCNKNNGIGKL